MKRFFSYIALLVLAFYVFHKTGVSYSYADLKDYLSVLLNISGMIFTIMGIWIAFIYPNALMRFSNPQKIEHVDFSASLDETRRLEGLVGTVIKAAAVMTGIMLLFFLKIVLSDAQIYVENKEIVKSLAGSFTIFLTLLQFESIGYMIYSNVMFINDLHSKREHHEADNDT